MLVKALKSFAGAVSMGAGETRDIDDKAILSDLIAAGYVEAEKVANAKEADIIYGKPQHQVERLIKRGCA